MFGYAGSDRDHCVHREGTVIAEQAPDLSHGERSLGRKYVSVVARPPSARSVTLTTNRGASVASSARNSRPDAGAVLGRARLTARSLPAA